jgi:hypothetical protein
MSISTSVRRRIEAQGFVGLDDGTLAAIQYWLRLSPAICMIWTAVGLFLGSPMVLWALVPFAALGAILPTHPFDVCYNSAVCYLRRTPPIPRYGLPRRFACLMATIFLIVAAWALQSGLPTLAYIAGGLLVAGAFVNISTGFCVPSFIYSLLFGKQPGAGNECVSVGSQSWEIGTSACQGWEGERVAGERGTVPVLVSEGPRDIGTNRRPGGRENDIT